MVWRRIQRRYPRAWTFLGRRLSPSEYLGLHLTVGLLVSVAAVLLFILVAEQVQAHTELTRIDESIAERLAENREETPILQSAFRFITQLGAFKVLRLAALVVALGLLLRRHVLLAVVWLLAVAGAGLLNGEIKHFYLRARPPVSLRDASIHETSASFPSGHSMGSLVFYGLLAYLLVLLWPRRWARVVAVAGLALLVLAIGFSRIYLCAHWPSDVVGGFLAGTVWLAVCISGIETVRRRRLHRRRALDEPTS